MNIMIYGNQFFPNNPKLKLTSVFIHDPNEVIIEAHETYDNVGLWAIDLKVDRVLNHQNIMYIDKRETAIKVVDIIRTRLNEIFKQPLIDGNYMLDIESIIQEAKKETKDEGVKYVGSKI